MLKIHIKPACQGKIGAFGVGGVGQLLFSSGIWRSMDADTRSSAGTPISGRNPLLGPCFLLLFYCFGGPAFRVV